MNKIEQLIQELCPGGVVKLPLEELCEFRNGYTPSKANKEFWEDGDIPWFRMEDIREGGRILSDSKQHITQKAIKGAGLFKANSIILATTATIGEHAMIIADSLANQQFTNLSIRKSLSLSVIPKYLFYYMFLVDEWCKNHVNVSGFASVDMAGLKKLEIPLPPLPIQQEIVRILDTFTEAQANLEQELELRKKQYEYYRNQLLTFDENDPSVKWMKISEFCDYVDYRGKTPKKVDSGIFLVTAKNIRYGYIDYVTSKEYIDPQDYNEVMHRGLPKIGDVLITTEAPCGNVAQVDREDIALAQRVIKYRSNESVMLNSFLKYLLLCSNVHNKILSLSNGGTVKGIKGSVLYQLSLPIIPIPKQQEIVSILDKFESAIQTLEEELALRKKQYEYYREKLLTFN